MNRLILLSAFSCLLVAYLLKVIINGFRDGRIGNSNSPFSIKRQGQPGEFWALIGFLGLVIVGAVFVWAQTVQNFLRP